MVDNSCNVCSLQNHAMISIPFDQTSRAGLAIVRTYEAGDDSQDQDPSSRQYAE